MQKIPQTQLKVGDLIFQSLLHQDEMTMAINSSHISKKVEHMGIIVSDGIVVEATIEDGVIQTPLESFLQKGAINLAYRFKDELIIPKVCNYIQEQIGMPYNDSFLDEADGFYCSELVEKAANYAKAGCFKSAKLNFCLSGSDVIAPFWKLYYEERNLSVPQGAKGSHPAGLMKQSEAIYLLGYVF
ncbi:MAG: YiiX/YebB-like N1pC/P60 family cysteine hydrolase [Alphaproteobacteria bacterium]